MTPGGAAASQNIGRIRPWRALADAARVAEDVTEARLLAEHGRCGAAGDALTSRMPAAGGWDGERAVAKSARGPLKAAFRI